MRINNQFKLMLCLSLFFCISHSGIALAVWQTSASFSIILGTRDKYGDQGSYEAKFVVIDPAKKEHTIKRVHRGDDFLEILFPKDFPGAYPVPGKYIWKIIINGELTEDGAFEFKPR
jgi:hypothetical protein